MSPPVPPDQKQIVTLDFEVFGKVQGVYFRANTKAEADKLDVRGWVKNTPAGSVVGHLEGTPEDMSTMKRWLRKTGSPKSRIDKAVFGNMGYLNEHEYSGFTIRMEKLQFVKAEK